MPRKPRKSRIVKKLSPTELAFLRDEPEEMEGPDGYELFCLRNGDKPFTADRHPRDLWEEHRSEFLPEWIALHPCSRPIAWWLFDAPRWDDPYDGNFFHGTLPEPRQRIGGTGTPNYECLAYVPWFEKGIPNGWVTKFQEDYYNGRALDVDGNIIPTEHKEGDFEGRAIDPEDPPLFESEAAYLQCHGLLTPAEVKYLERHPEILEPVRVEAPEDENS